MIVKGPEGQLVDFPDDVTSKEIAQYFNTYYPMPPTNPSSSFTENNYTHIAVVIAIMILAVVLYRLLKGNGNNAASGIRNKLRSLSYRNIAIFTAVLALVIAAGFFFRFEKEQIGDRIIRYDRYTSLVEWQSVFSKTGEWRPTKYKNLQQAKAVFQRHDLENATDSVKRAIDDAKEENERYNEQRKLEADMQQQQMEMQKWEQQRQIEDLKRKLDESRR